MTVLTIDLASIKHRISAILVIVSLCSAIAAFGYNYAEIRDQSAHIARLEDQLKGVATKDDVQALKEMLAETNRRLGVIEAALLEARVARR